MQGNKWETSTDVTSIPASSPPRSPLNPARSSSSDRPPKPRPHPNAFYFVQSPSQFDGESLYNKSSLSLQSSPTASPRHPHHLDYSSRRPSKSHGKAAGAAPWSTTCSVINEEDGLYAPRHPYQHPADRLSARVRCLIFLLFACGALLGLLILLIWVATKPTAPQVFIKNVVFHEVYIGPGEDASGVPTNFIKVNCTIQIDYINTSKHLKVHLHPLQAELLYSKLSIVVQKVDNYAQSKKSHNVVPVQLYAERVALYGASHDLPSSQESINQGFDLPLRITTSILSKYYVVSKMVTSKFLTQIMCKVDVNTKSLALLSPISNSCI